MQLTQKVEESLSWLQMNECEQLNLHIENLSHFICEGIKNRGTMINASEMQRLENLSYLRDLLKDFIPDSDVKVTRPVSPATKPMEG